MRFPKLRRKPPEPSDGAEFAYSAVRKVLYENGHAEATLDIDAEIMTRMFDVLSSYVVDAPNYRTAEATFKPAGRSEREAITITVQKRIGLTPHQLRMAAERERDDALAENEQLRLLVGWYALEPCEHMDDGWSCEVATDLMPEERCGPCQARIAIGTRSPA